MRWDAIGDVNAPLPTKTVKRIGINM